LEFPGGGEREICKINTFKEMYEVNWNFQTVPGVYLSFENMPSIGEGWTFSELHNTTLSDLDMINHCSCEIKALKKIQGCLEID